MLAALALAALVAVTAPARLDATFGHSGTVRVDLGGADTAEALLLQPDGQVAVAGSSTAGTSPAFLRTYDTSGKPHLQLVLDAAGVDQIPALAQQPDGKLLAAWQTLTTRGETVIYRVRLVRLNSDGSTDFNVDVFNGGAPGLQGGGPAGAQAIAVQPDGKIVVLLGTALVCLNRDGAQAFRIDFGLTDVARALALQPSGRILVAGTRSGAPFLDAYGSDGTPDPTFKATLGPGSPQALAVLPDGRIDIATRTQVERLLPTGAVETTGAVPGPAIALDAQGRVVAAGAGGIRRLTTSLMPDGSFGAAGTAGLGGVDPAAVAVQPDGKVLVAGTVKDDAVVVRLPANAAVRRPVVTVTRRPRTPLRAPARAVFAFRADTRGATFRCSLDEGVLRPCGSPRAYRVPAGPHRFRVQALSGGVTGPTVAVRFSVVPPR
jgi:uncharacterized delta-60 repeat protein